MSQYNRQPLLINPSAKRVFHGAGWIVADADQVIENGCIEVADGVIQSIYHTRPNKDIIDHGPGVLMPSLVNTHLHLELSALKDLLPFDRGFKSWVKALLKKREALGEADLIEKARQAVNTLAESGTGLIGEISTLNITWPLLKQSGVGGICFHEFLGSSADNCRIEKGRDISLSLAGHAPHSTSPMLLQMLKEKSARAGLPFSIHVAESVDETEFIRDKKGVWADFLTSRGIDWSGWPAGGRTPVEYIYKMGILDVSTLVVHALRVSSGDLVILARSKAGVCVCPRSNMNLHGKLPDIEAMMKNGIAPALGTDSLASCSSLSMFDEMAFVRENYPGLEDETIFSMGTINGAKALGMGERAGTLSPGKDARLVYLPVKVKNRKNIFRKIVSNE